MSGNLIQSFGQLLQVTRFSGGSYVNGSYVAGTSTTFLVIMAIMPLTEKELLALPEGERTRRQMKGYLVEELKTVDTSDSKKADRVTYDGVDFEVQGVEKWDGDLPHYKVRLAEAN